MVVWAGIRIEPGKPLFISDTSVCFCGSDLHAVQCGAGTAHTAGPEAALLGKRPVAQSQQLTAQSQILSAQPRLKAALGVFSEQLAAAADILGSELWEGGRAVSIVPEVGQKVKEKSMIYVQRKEI